MESILETMNYPPNFIITDAGGEFTSRKNTCLYKLFTEKFNIHHYISTGDGHNAVGERAIGTLKRRLARYFTENNTKKWIDIYEKLVHAYNQTYHTSIKMAPNDVNFENFRLVHNNLYGDVTIPERCRLSKGNIVSQGFIEMDHVCVMYFENSFKNTTLKKYFCKRLHSKLVGKSIQN